MAALVRRHDRDRYQTALFAPSAEREALLAIYAFNYEIARVRELVSEPMLGRIRLEWWRENISDAFGAGPVRRHRVVEALAETVRRRPMSRAHFEALIAAREADLEAAPPATLAALEEYAEASSASLDYLALEALGVGGAAASAAAREVGIAYALAGLIRALPLHAGSGRRYIPDDVAARAGLDLRDYERLKSPPALRAAVGEIAAVARRYLDTARERRAEMPRDALPALLPAVVAARSLARLRRAGCDPYDPALRLPDPLQVWRLGVAAFLRRY
ncbi:MAG TPA: squalene/phytoene synthase family protein [Stellaceae bacterium]|nr:squalene/phytoene synthase family protein [Stellaceae bacterium]